MMGGNSNLTGRGRRALVLWTVGLAVTWLVVLPWVSAQRAPQARIEWLREQKISPTAMYYTEVEAHEPVLERLNAELTGRF